MNCPKCNAVNDDGNKFCERCGQPLILQPYYCPKCGKELSSAATFCPNCGHKKKDKGSANVKKYLIIGGIAALVVLLIVICLIFFKSSNTDNVNNDGTLSGITDDIQNGDGNIIDKKRRFKREGNQIFLIEDITEIRDGNTSKYTNKKLLGYVEKVFKSPDAINTSGRCDNSNYAGMLTEKYDLDGNGTKDNIKMYQPSDYNSVSRHQASDVVIEISNANKSMLNTPANFVCILITHTNGINDILITGEGADTLYYAYYQWNGRCYAESPDYTVPDRNPNDLVFTTVKDSIGKKIGNNDTMYVVAKVQKPIEGPKKLVDAIIKWEKSIIGGNSQQSIETLVNNYVKNNWNEIKSLAGDFVNDDDLYGRFLNEFTINKAYENDVLVTLYSNQFVCDGGPRASENNNFYASFNKKLGKVLGLEIFKNNSWNSIEPMLLQEVKDGIFDQSQITSLPKPISLYIANNKVYFEYSSVYDIDPNFVGPGYWTSGISFGLPMSKVKKYFTDEFINCLQE